MLYNNGIFCRNPTPDGNPNATYPTWPNYQISNPQYYKLDLTPEVLRDYPATNWRKGYSK